MSAAASARRREGSATCAGGWWSPKSPGIAGSGATKRLHERPGAGMLPAMRKERDRDAEDGPDEIPFEEEEESEAPARPASKRRRRKPKAAEPDEDEAEEEQRPRKAKPSRRATSARRRRKGRPKRPQPPTEAQIDSPKQQTLYMLGAVAIATVVMWGAARFACNAHPPASKKPRHATAADFARTPKGAAIELQQRWIGHEYSAAMELAKGEAAEQILRDLHACETDISACDKKREQAAGKLKSIAELVSSTRRRAKVRVRTSLDGQAPQTYLLELELGPYWWQTVKRTAE